MALEPRTATVDDEENPELVDMRRRFWISVALTIPLVAVAMGEHLPGHPLARIATMSTLGWLQLVLATPVVLWGGWPFFVRGWQSVVHRSLNMFTLIGLGVGVAYLYSLVAKLFPGIFPPSFRLEGGDVAVYFEAAAAIMTLVLLGQVLELKARSRTGSRHQGAPRPRAEDGPAPPGRRHRGGCPSRAGSPRRPAARAARGEGAGGRRRPRRDRARWTSRWSRGSPSPWRRSRATAWSGPR